MEQQQEEIERNNNYITWNTSFESPITINVQKKDAHWSLERWLAADVLEEMIKELKGCTIQSDEQVNKIFDYEEHVDERKCIRKYSA